MTPERRRQTERLFEVAASMDAALRAGFLDQVCDGDATLRREIELLLELELQAQDFLERPALLLEATAMGRERQMAGLCPGTQVGPYYILSGLGTGGMGEVYRARDTRLDRDVALKFLPSDMAQDEHAKARFKREARAASALNHANICSIFDSGEYDGLPFFVMELLEGQTLRERLLTGPLVPVTELVSVALQIATALEAAHTKGIIHRDIKPANIFLTASGAAKMLDFGVAKRSADTWPASNLEFSSQHQIPIEHTATLPGTMMGTAPYMAPEQIRGESVDARSDIFSLGATLYQAGTGALPFAGGSGQEIIERILTGTPLPPRKLRPDLPRELERIILKALEKDPAQRFQSAAELHAALARLQHRQGYWQRRRWSWGATGCILVVMAGILWVAWARRPLIDPPVQRVVVLPLRNVSGNPGQDHMVDGIAEAIAGDLGKLRTLRVISRSSAAAYKMTAKKPSEIGRELGVDAIVAGSVAASGGRLKITVQLIRTTTEQTLWADTFDLDFRGLQSLQRTVAQAVARATRLQLAPSDDARLARAGTASPEAFDAYLRGKHYWTKRTEENLERAVRYFRIAIDADPAYAAAYAALADCYNQFGTMIIGRSPAEYRSLAIAAARRAIDLDDQIAEAHNALGFAKLFDWDWAGAELELSRALDLNPSYAPARVWRANYLAMWRRFDEAVVEVERARDLDPLSLLTQTQVAWIYRFAGREDESISQSRKVLSIEPDYLWALWQLGLCYMDEGRYRDAIPMLERAVVVSGNNPSMMGALGEAYALSGRRAEAKTILAQLYRLSSERYVTPHAAAFICFALNDTRCGFHHLDKGAQDRSYFMPYLPLLPQRYARGVRSDARFQELLRRMGFDGE